MAAVRPRILLVDDDPLVRATLRIGLRDADYQVTEASCGNDALVCAERESFDLMITDIRMPDMSGIDLARRLRVVKGIPVLFLSAYSETALVEAAIAEGGLGYLVKPVDIAQVIPALEAALVRAREMDALLKNKEQLEKTLMANRLTSVAVGILMDRHRMDREQAFAALRQSARARQVQLEQAARELVEALETINRTR